MIFLLMLFILGCGYYTFTYGISLWRDDHNKVGAIASIGAAVVGTVLPIIIMYLKR